MRTTYRFGLYCAVLLTARAAFAQANAQTLLPLQIGDTVAVAVDSPHPYVSGPQGGLVWQHTFHKDDATFVRVHFTDASVLGAGDSVIVRDGQGRQVRQYTNARITDRWTPSVEGETVTVEIWAAPNSQAHGVVIDEVAWGFYPLFPDESNVAGNTYFPICDTAVESRIRTADPVARLSWVDDCGGVFLCSGWLFSPQGHLMTNAHCANSAGEANNLESWFNYTPTQCDLPAPIQNPDNYDDGTTFVVKDCDRDFAVHKVFDPVKGNPATRYGYLHINPSVPANGAGLWLPQHPGGIRKQIAEDCSVNDSLEPGFNGCADPPSGCNNGGFPVSSYDLSFNCGIAGGSSGSPVLNLNDEVVAIAHAGNGTENFGVRMFNIVPFLPNFPVNLDINGRAMMNEGESIQVNAVADYLVGSSHTVTVFTSWTVLPPTAGSVDSTGLFTAGFVTADTEVTIAGSYTEDDVTVHGQLSIIVMNTGTEGPVLNVTLVPSVDPNNLTPGQNFFADVMISTDESNLNDIRLIQLDTALSTGVTINSVDWAAANPIFGANTLYSFFEVGSVRTAYWPLSNSIPGFILNLTSTPQAVARINATFNANGQLDVFGTPTPPSVDQSIRLLSGFTGISEFSQVFSNVMGGSLALGSGTGSPSIVSSDPPNNAIDARQPSNIDGSNPNGWQSVDLTFSGSVAGLTPADFTILHSADAIPPPTVSSIMILGPNSLRVNFSTRMLPALWTTIRHNDSNTSVRLGYLPGDTNGDGTSSPIDVLALINALNGIGMPLPLWSTDANRSGVAEPSDILREIDLLNGAGAFEIWNGVSLP